MPASIEEFSFKTYKSRNRLPRDFSSRARDCGGGGIVEVRHIIAASWDRDCHCKVVPDLFAARGQRHTADAELASLSFVNCEHLRYIFQPVRIK